MFQSVSIKQLLIKEKSQSERNRFLTQSLLVRKQSNKFPQFCTMVLPTPTQISAQQNAGLSSGYIVPRCQYSIVEPESML